MHLYVPSPMFGASAPSFVACNSPRKKVEFDMRSKGETAGAFRSFSGSFYFFRARRHPHFGAISSGGFDYYVMRTRRTGQQTETG